MKKKPRSRRNNNKETVDTLYSAAQQVKEKLHSKACENEESLRNV